MNDVRGMMHADGLRVEVRALRETIEELELIRKRSLTIFALIELGQDVQRNQLEHERLVRRRRHLLEVAGVTNGMV